MNNFYTKRKLTAIIKNRDIIDRIEQDVLEVSNLVKESGLYIYYTMYESLYQGPPANYSVFNFQQHFRDLIIGGPLNKQYAAIRNLPKYDGRNRIDFISVISNQYEIAFKDNIVKHAYTRVRKFLRKLHPFVSKSEINENLKFLFQKTKHGYKQTISFHFKWKRGHFCNVDTRPMDYVNDFFLIQIMNEANNWKNFTLVPLYKSGRKHLYYDENSFINMLGRRPSGTFHWDDYLNLDEGQQFNGSFTTDGMTIALNYVRCDEKKMVQCQYDTCIGIDPGVCEFLAAVREGPTKKIENIRISFEQYQEDNCTHARNKKRKEYLSTFDSLVNRERTRCKIDGNARNTCHFEKFVEFELKWHLTKQQIYNDRKVAKLKYDAHYWKKSTINHYIRDYLVKDSKGVAVYYGNAFRAPGKLMMRMLAHYPNVKLTMVDEYRTSKLCSICMSELEFYPVWAKGDKRWKRFVSCRACGNVFHRDINAANNIMKIGQLGPSLRPLKFRYY